MKYVIVTGSHRKQSQSEKVAKYLEKRLVKFDERNEVSFISLAENPLPLWDEEVWQGTPRWQEAWKPIAAQLTGADALIFIVPEWGGMVPPGFKNFLLLCSSEIAHKPALLVSVSAGISGSYPISELRMSGYKNTQVAYLPEHLIIRNVGSVLNEDSINLEFHEDKLRERIDYTLKLLGVYGKAFQQIRNTEEINLASYPYGM